MCESHLVARAQQCVLEHLHHEVATLVEQRIENPRGNDDRREARERAVDQAPTRWDSG